MGLSLNAKAAFQHSQLFASTRFLKWKVFMQDNMITNKLVEGHTEFSPFHKVPLQNSLLTELAEIIDTCGFTPSKMP